MSTRWWLAGTWTLEAAEAVCGIRDLANEDVLDLLGRLVRKSLVAGGEPGDGAKRFELLETVRDYARQKVLARGTAETTAVRERHAVYYSGLADQLHPTRTHAFVGWLSTDPTLPTARRRFEEVQHDLWVALEWWLNVQRRREALGLAVTLSAFWTWFGQYAEARHCLEPALELARLTELSPAEDSSRSQKASLFEPQHCWAPPKRSGAPAAGRGIRPTSRITSGP